jgi:hypothetical protein
MTAGAGGVYTGERLSGPTGGRRVDVVTNELAKLAAAVERQTTVDGTRTPTVPALGALG